MMKTVVPTRFSRLTITGLCAAAIAAASPALHAQTLAAQYVPQINTIAGTGASGYTGDGALATAATLNTPTSATYDVYGNLYIADTGNSVVRRVDAVTGVITTVAGNGTAGYSGDGAAATSAQLNRPFQVAVDRSDNLYIADFANCVVRKVTAATGIITTLIGEGPQGGGTASSPCPNKTPTTVTATAGVSPLSFLMSGPVGIAVDGAGDVYFDSYITSRIYKLFNIATGTFTANTVYLYAGSSSNNNVATTADIAATTAPLGQPTLLNLDRQGNLFFTDRRNDLVFVVVPSGTGTSGFIYQIAGTNDAVTDVAVPGNTGDGGAANSATLDFVNITLGAAAYPDAAGNVYIGDVANNRVRIVSGAGSLNTPIPFSSGIINNYAGNAAATSGSSGDGGPATSAYLSEPVGVTADYFNTRFAVADYKNNKIRMITVGNAFPRTAVGGTSAQQNIVAEATTAGTATSFGVPASASEFTAGSPAGCPGAMAASATCSVLAGFSPAAPGLRTARLTLADSGGGNASVGLVGIGLAPAANFVAGNLSTVDSAGTAGIFAAPDGMALDVSGNIYVADTSHNRLELISASTGAVTTFAGTGAAGFLGDGSAAASAQLNAPQAVALDPLGNLYIADTGNNRVRMVSYATGNISTVAGGASAGSSGDGGKATSALLNAPQDIAADLMGNIYIADTANNKIRGINAISGVINTIVGTGTAGTSPDGTLPASALLSAPAGVAVDATGNIFISDAGNSLIREVYAGGAIYTVAGNGTAASTGDGGAARSASILTPTHLSVDAADDVYFAESGSSKVREVGSASGIINTVAGTGTAGISADGALATLSMLSGPHGVKADHLGNVYIVDTGNNRIAKVSSAAETVAFGNQLRGTTSATQTINLQDFGNQPLTLTGLSLSSSSFAQVTGSPSDCTATTVLASGANCNLRLTFNPAAGGNLSATLTVTDNALNLPAAAQTVALTGIGVVIPGIITPVAGNNQTIAPNAQFVPLKVLVTDTSNYAAPGASVTFTAPGGGATGIFTSGSSITVTTGTDGTAAVPMTASLTRGMFNVTASVTGVSTPATFTETIAGNLAPAVAVTVPAGTITYGQTATLGATLTPYSYNSNSATGTISFFVNGSATAVCSGTVSTGAASCSYSPNAGVNSITAIYSGDANFSTAQTTSAASYTVAQLAITATTASVTLPYGNTVPAIPGTLTGVLGKDTANVSVTFAPGTAQTYPDVGVYPLTPTLAGSAAGNYSVTATGSPTLTFTIATTATSLTLTPNPVYLGAYLTLSAAVATTVPGGPTPTGTVTFTLTPATGTAVTIGPSTLTAGTASARSNTLPAGVYAVTATYNGVADYAVSGSASQSLTVQGPDFTVTSTTSTLSIQQGARAYITLTVDPNQIFTGAVSFACPIIPAGFTCNFFPSTVAASGSTVLTISTDGPTSAAVPAHGRKGIALAMIWLPALLLGGFAARSRRRRLAMLGVVLLMLSGLAGLSACGNGITGPATPLGYAVINVSSTSGAIVHGTAIAVTVTAPTPTN